VHAVFADMNRHVNDGGEYVVTSTHGSQLVRQQHPHIMQAGASARERLKEAAAKAWGVDRSEVTAKQGILASGSKRGTYAEFATAAAGATLEREPAIKTPEEWWLLGKPTARLDAAVKVDGSARFAIDARPDGMVYAAVKCCPVPWGRLVSHDFDRIGERPGVIAAVELRSAPGRTDNSDMQDGVAVVADSWYHAKAALDAMPIEWDFGAEGEISSATQAAKAAELLESTGNVSREDGNDTLGIIAASDNVISSDYHRPYETHARMEPINATVSVTADRVDVWSPTQNQATALLLVADQLGRNTEDVHVHTALIGGAFGGNGGGATAVTRQAAEISRQVGKPVKVIWSREEDMMQDKQRAPVYARLSAVLGDDALPEAVLPRAVIFARDAFGTSLGDRGRASVPAGVPTRRHASHGAPAHGPPATHRAPGPNQTGFIIERFVDGLAVAGDWDPLEWRLEMTRGMEPWQRVLTKLKEVAGFRTNLPRGQGMGIAVLEDHASYCAACATVSVSRGGELKVDKVVLVMNS